MAEDKPKNFATYRCTRCNSTFFKVDKEATAEDVANLAMNPLATSVNDVFRVMTHPCDDGGVGLAAIVGITPEGVVEKLTSNEESEPGRKLN